MKTSQNSRMLSITLLLLLSIFFSGCGSYISKEAQQTFNNHEGPISLTIYPVNIVKCESIENDRDLAMQVKKFMQKENMADAVIAENAAQISFEWGINQAKMCQQSAIAFARVVKEDAIQTEYALLVEILCNANETGVGGVHFYLCDRNGQLANGSLTNSHWEEFKDIKPHDRDGGIEVALRMLSNNWK